MNHECKNKITANVKQQKMEDKAMRLRCKRCGDLFTPTEEEQELISEGYANPPDYCDDCSVDEICSDIYELSDADPWI
jgi:hypothetical protein